MDRKVKILPFLKLTNLTNAYVTGFIKSRGHSYSVIHKVNALWSNFQDGYLNKILTQPDLVWEPQGICIWNYQDMALMTPVVVINKQKNYILVDRARRRQKHGCNFTPKVI